MVVLVYVEGPKDRSELNEQEATKSIDVLLVFDIASFHVFLAIEESDCLIQEVIFEVTLWHPDQQLRHKPAYR